MSVPEPPPVPKGQVVPGKLIEFLTLSKEALQNREDLSVHTDAVIALIKDRDTFGRAKYGQPLMSEDGRNGVEDAKQELGDLLQYLMKCKISGQKISEEDLGMFMVGIVVAEILLKTIFVKK
jgi:hypothetical protein